MGAVATLEKPVPVLLAFGCGVLLARRKTIPAGSSKVFTDYAFLVAVPCYLFRNIYTSDLGTLFDWRAILGYAATAAVAMLAITGLTLLVLAHRLNNSLASVRRRCLTCAVHEKGGGPVNDQDSDA